MTYIIFLIAVAVVAFLAGVKFSSKIEADALLYEARVKDAIVSAKFVTTALPQEAADLWYAALEHVEAKLGLKK